MEVTETGTTSSENASSPRTEIQILDDDLKINNDKPISKQADDELLEEHSCHSGRERKHNNPGDICEKIQEVTDEEKKIKEYKSVIKQRKEDLKAFVDCHIDDNEVFRRYVEEDDIFRKYIENEKLFQNGDPEDEEVVSNSSYICDCPAHIHDKENPLELVEVSIDRL